MAMADVMRIVREWEKEKQRKSVKTAAGNFTCHLCGDHFDTRIGLAAHQGYGCGVERIPQPTIATMSRCPACGSYALYRTKSGVICESCKVRQDG
jgi:ribosomal protein L37AE/L43A